MSTGEYQRYRFGPIERRGLIGSLRPAQVILIAASLTGSVILMRILSSGIGVVAALALTLLASIFCFWPINGRSVEAWLPIVGRHAARRALRRHVQRSPAPPSPDGPSLVDVSGPSPTRPRARPSLPSVARAGA